MKATRALMVLGVIFLFTKVAHADPYGATLCCIASNPDCFFIPDTQAGASLACDFHFQSNTDFEINIAADDATNGGFSPVVQTTEPSTGFDGICATSTVPLCSDETGRCNPVLPSICMAVQPQGGLLYSLGDTFVLVPSQNSPYAALEQCVGNVASNDCTYVGPGFVQVGAHSCCATFTQPDHSELQPGSIFGYGTIYLNIAEGALPPDAINRAIPQPSLVMSTNPSATQLVPGGNADLQLSSLSRGRSVYLVYDGTIIQTGTTDSTGAWEYIVNNLTPGSHTAYAVTDGMNSNIVAIDIGDGQPNVPTLPPPFRGLLLVALLVVGAVVFRRHGLALLILVACLTQACSATSNEPTVSDDTIRDAAVDVQSETMPEVSPEAIPDAQSGDVPPNGFCCKLVVPNLPPDYYDACSITAFLTTVHKSNQINSCTYGPSSISPIWSCGVIDCTVDPGGYCALGQSCSYSMDPNCVGTIIACDSMFENMTFQ